jgi:hypothetical protein
MIASDAEAACVIMILSDANAAFSLPVDEARQEILWVDDFTDNEANEFLDNAHFLLKNTQKRNQIFEQIGTRPAELNKIVGLGIYLIIAGEDHIDAHLAEWISNAKITLLGLLDLKFTEHPDTAVNFKRIHHALLKYPTGVLAHSLSDHGATGNAQEVCVHLRRYHCFMYHYPSKEYRYAGREFRIAAKDLGIVDQSTK